MTQYLHHVPGRLRARAGIFLCDTEQRRNLLRRLQETNGVRLVCLNGKAGSVTVHYDVEKTALDSLLQVLEFQRVEVRAPSPVPRRSPLKGALVGMVGKMALNMLVSKGINYSLSSLLRTRI